MPQFTPGELAVMRLLWQHGEMKPGQIQRLFPQPIKNPALRSHLSILLGKGHVGRRKLGKAYFYRAVTRQQSAFRSTLRELVDGYCGGSIHSLLLGIIESERLSEQELLAIKRLAGSDEQKPLAGRRKKR
jgi:predicted transcriptional regulator